MVPSFFRLSLLRFLYLLGAYFLTRVLFLLWNWSIFGQDRVGEIIWAFVLGLRFDTSAILLTNALSFVLWMLPGRWLKMRSLRVIDLILFGVVNLICLGVNFVDAEFVKFIGKRSSYDLFFIRGDMEQQWASILLTYWYFCLGLTILVGLLLYFYPRPAYEPKPEGWVSGSLWRLVAVWLIFTGMRGGYGFKPLNPMQAYFSTKHELGLLTLNTPFNLIKTRPNGQIERARYFATDKEAILRLKKMTDLTRPPLGVAKDWNVVVLIVESFALEYTGVGHIPSQSYTPFFDSLTKKSFFFSQNFANARRSIEGIPAVLCGLPSMMEEPIITSDFSSNRLDCLPKILSQHGYETWFLHGAHNGSMHFDSFSRLAGFENFVGLDEYPKTNPEDLDEYWGVLDEPMLQYATKIIDEAKQPIFLSVFTLSSHHPYYIPPKYRGKFPKGTLEIHESIGYTDYSLEQFFKTASRKPWFNHTIFVLTADHTQKTEHREYETIEGYLRVPMVFYIPGLKSEKVNPSPNRITQHIDIMPSIFDLLGVTVPDRLLLGQSIFDQGNVGRSYNVTVYSYWYMDPKVFIDFARNGGPLKTFTHTGSYDLVPLPNTDERIQDPLLNLKAVVHYFNEGLIHNSLYNWRDSL